MRHLDGLAQNEQKLLKVIVWFVMLLFLAAAVALMAASVNIARNEQMHMRNWELLLSFYIVGAVLLLVVVLGLFRLMYTEYHFLSAGLQIRYPMKRTRVISWDKFQQICICYHDSGAFLGRGKSLEAPAAVLCFVQNGVKRNESGRWTTVHLIPTERVIALECSEERYQKLAEVYSGKIEDLRDTEPYRPYRAKDKR